MHTTQHHRDNQDHATVFDRYDDDFRHEGDLFIASGDRHDLGVETLCVGEAA